MQIETIVLESTTQKLHLVPALGGGVAAWEWKTADGPIDLFRPWDGISDDIYTLACFPLVPWSNRITQGGFEQDGMTYPIATNRIKEPYPIHGDGWLQQWQVSKQTANSVELSITSRCFAGNPYEYSCTQTFTLLPDGLEIDLTVTHLGDKPLPYGLGLHPYFMRDEKTRLRAKAGAVWLSGVDPIPTKLTQDFPATWDYNQSAALPMSAELIDNCFTGWDGIAEIADVSNGLNIRLEMDNCTGYSLMYRPPELHYFCFEPITHPIDAFHMPGRPGLVILSTGQSTTLKTSFKVKNQ